MPPSDTRPHGLSRRALLQTAAPVAALAPTAALAQPAKAPAGKVEPFPLEAVRLLPSPFLTAVDANRAYLHRLEPDRLLHNFREHAGLKPKGEVYGGWESDTIAGHTLGHYMTALALMYAQTGDAESKRRLVYIIDELETCQAQSPDGYVAGFKRKRGDIVEDGKLALEEVKRGDIRSAGFDLNGSWVPFYTWHKLYAGLLDADRFIGSRKAIPIAERLGGYIEGVFAGLTDAQVQSVLDCEHGGLNESFAELYARTGNRRWLALSQKIYHRKILDPLAERRDSLSNVHANTQVPKIIGLARLYELTGDPRYATASGFFWETVLENYSYVIGGNSDREYFQAPKTISRHITEQTCESCNTYNMLKLTRHLYAREPRAAHFDYYERAHLNHILGHQNPRTGGFCYMSPLMSGTHREYSSDFDDFWCCVGTGMESHAKHGESIWWRAPGELIANLYIPSALTWEAQGAKVEMTTGYPFDDVVKIRFVERRKRGPLSLALRVPAWCEAPRLAVNGEGALATPQGGYLRIRRAWKAGDEVTLTLPRTLRLEPTPDDPKTVAVLFGPLVMAGDLGPATGTWSGPAPVLVGADLTGAMAPQAEPAVFRTQGVVRPGDLTLRPYAFAQERNTAVYFRRFTDAEWVVEQASYKAEQARLADLQARSADVMHLGEMQAERDHKLESKISYPVVYRGRNGRDARSGGFFEFTMKARPGPLVLQATYWGEERNRRFRILVDGVVVAQERLTGERPGEFFERDYPIPPELTRGKSEVRVRFEPETGVTAGPSFGVRLFSPAAAPQA
jgi:hypothetical protein